LNLTREQFISPLLLCTLVVLVACENPGSSTSEPRAASPVIPTVSTGPASQNSQSNLPSQSVDPETVVQNPRQIAPQPWYEQPFSCAPKSMNWVDVNDWFYQLQVSDFELLANSKYDLLVIDGDPPSHDLNRNVVERMKCGGDGEKFLVSYLSVGQAENYRDYWQPDWGVGNPTWIAYADEFWIGDYFVRYWDEQWQQILFSRVDAMVDKGFDALYLDVIDAYAFFESERATAREDMRLLIAAIAQRARTRSNNPDFGIFVQNAEELIEQVPQWAEPLTGIGKEEPFYWAMDTIVEDGQRFWNDHYLSQWVAAGKLVINVDYVTNPAFIDEVYSASRQKGYVPLTLRQTRLDQFEIVPGYEPD